MARANSSVLLDLCPGLDLRLRPVAGVAASTAVVPADQPETEAGDAGPQPPQVVAALQPVVEGEKQDERERPQRRTDLHRPDTVEVERLHVGDEIGAVADLVHHRLVVLGKHLPNLVSCVRPGFDPPVTWAAVAHGWIPRVDKFFKITERASTIGQEVRGGVVTFFTMAYIIVLNPLILGFVPDAEGNLLGGEGPGNLAAIAAGTALVAGVLT